VSGGTLRIGAMTTLSTLEHSADVRKLTPVITRTLRTLSNVRVRNVATVGGALAHADPHMDLPPVLIALGATMSVVGPVGTHEVAVEDLFTGYYETVLKKNELIAELRVPAQDGKRAAYLKVTTGSADDWPALGVAVAIEGDGASVKSVRVVASAATSKATRLVGAEKVLTDQRIDQRRLASVWRPDDGGEPGSGCLGHCSCASSAAAAAVSASCLLVPSAVASPSLATVTRTVNRGA
jgi:carbon-monoxide dehydrogenase medium subunit